MTVMPFEHADEAAAALREVVAEQGRGVLSDPLMLGSLLADLLPAAPSAVRILVAAAEDHVADTISENVSQGIGADAAVRMAANSFARTSLSAPEVSQWVATAFASASGLAVGPSGPATPAGFQSGGQPGFYGQNPGSGPQSPPATAANWASPAQNAPTMQPGISPSGQPGYQQGFGPGISPGGQPGYQPGFGPGISPGTPGYQQGSSPGANPGFQSGRPPGPPPVSPFGYQPYQSAGQSSAAQKLQFAPQYVLNAVKLMYAGIALSALLAIADFTEAGILGSQLYLTSHQSSEAGASAVGAVMGLLGIGLWIWMAWANKRGLGWARIVASISFGIFVLYSLVSIVDVTPFAIVIELGTVAVGLIALISIWRRESSAYYQLPTS